MFGEQSGRTCTGAGGRHHDLKAAACKIVRVAVDLCDNELHSTSTWRPVTPVCFDELLEQSCLESITPFSRSTGGSVVGVEGSRIFVSLCVGVVCDDGARGDKSRALILCLRAAKSVLRGEKFLLTLWLGRPVLICARSACWWFSSVKSPQKMPDVVMSLTVCDGWHLESRSRTYVVDGRYGRRKADKT